MKFANTLKLSFVAALTAAPFAFAEDHDHEHGDIRPYVIDGQIFTGFYNDEEGDSSFRPDVRVFGFEFGENPDIPFGGDIGVNPGSGFTGGTLRFALTGTLTYWDGTGEIAFGAPAAGTSLTIGGASNATATGSGISYANASFSSVFLQNVPSGSHAHVATELAASGGDPAAGIYAVEMVLLNLDSLGNPLNIASPTAYLLFNNGIDEHEHGEAIEYFETNVVPEPASLAVLGLGAAALLRRRRGLGA